MGQNEGRCKGPGNNERLCRHGAHLSPHLPPSGTRSTDPKWKLWGVFFTLANPRKPVRKHVASIKDKDEATLSLFLPAVSSIPLPSQAPTPKAISIHQAVKEAPDTDQEQDCESYSKPTSLSSLIFVLLSDTSHIPSPLPRRGHCLTLHT